MSTTTIITMPISTPKTENTSVLFKFKCGYNPMKTVTGHHDIPTSFIGSLFKRKRLETLIHDIIDTYEDPGALLHHSNQTCPICGKPSTGTNVQPTSGSLHSNLEDSNPRIECSVIGYCGNRECLWDLKVEIGDHDERERLSERLRQWEAAHPEEEQRKPGKCGVCEKAEGTKFCNKCKVTAYCGKWHQKEDWKVHKKVCAKLAQEEAMAAGESEVGNWGIRERMRTRTMD